MHEEQTLKGELKAIFFENQANFYKVLLLSVEESSFDTDKDEMVVTGNFGDITVDTPYTFYGTVVTHPKYGLQFNAKSYEREKPVGKNGLIAFFSSDRFPGIGQKTAEKIVELLGEGAIDKILSDSLVLLDIPGMTQKKRKMIYDVLQVTQGTERALLDLAKYGFTNHQAAAILNRYQEKTIQTLEENPYQLLEDIEGFGFKRCDQLAEELSFAADHPKRIQGAILQTLQTASFSNGDTYLEGTMLMDQALQLLESSRRFLIEDSQIIEAIIQLVTDMKIMEDQQRFALPSLYFAEIGISNRLNVLLEKSKKEPFDEEEIDSKIEEVQETLGITYDEIQKQAIREAMKQRFFILTGGPGTGKTTVLRGIVTLYCLLHDLPTDPTHYTEGIYPILMAAPTGRAAKRMNEMTGIQSSTIHRLLGLTGQENQNEDVYTQELEGDLLIIDESSMVDTWLMNRLLQSIPPHMKVIFVGDKDQLPSVGPGQVLHDLLASKVIPHVELERIYRQANGSSIISLAHDVKNGNLPATFRANQSDRSFFECQATQIEPLIRIIVEKAKKKGYTSKDIQVLAPMYKGPAGIHAINTMMQEILNPNSDQKRREVAHFDSVYRVGDKVLQLINQPELSVFNGDIGEITAIQFAKETEDKVDELTILFDAIEVTYQRNEWNKITLAYCCSIHKAQGSEFPMVILPMVRQYGRMLRRNLLYTAITRSKDKLILCGEQRAFAFAAESTGDLRRTLLVEKLTNQSSETKEVPLTLEKESVKVEKTAPERVEEPEAPEYLTMEAIGKQVIDPMIGMEDATPYDFLQHNA